MAVTDRLRQVLNAASTVKADWPGEATLRLSLARPDVANALNTRMGEDLLAIWRVAADATGLRAVILTGEGKAFCAGADLKERRGMDDEAWQAQHRIFEEMIRVQLACPAPVIGAVNGPAFGGGCELALACDIILAAEGARFALPEAGLGIMPGLGGTVMLPAAVGVRRAKELLFTGRPFSAAQAHDWGMVNAVYAAEALSAEASGLAEAIAANGPLAVRALKRSVDGSVSQPLDQAMDHELNCYGCLIGTADRREGVEAFNAHRRPRFTGA